MVKMLLKIKLVSIKYTSTQEIPLGLLTKGLLSIKHKFMKMIGVIPI